MRRFFLAAAFLTLLGTFTTSGTAQEKDEVKKKAQAALAQMLNGSPEDFIKRFDKNGDGLLTRKELPPRMAAGFELFDRNADGLLDKEEVAEMLKALRAGLGDEARPPQTKPATPKTPDTKPGSEKGNPQVEAIVNDILQRMDTNKDGKISKEEAKDIISANFARIDTNGDGFIDKAELRQMALRRLASQAGPGGPGFPGGNRPGPDFDALDKDADGRLTRDELKSTPLADKFDQIDTNKDGKVDVKEFRAYLKKQQEEKK